VVILALSAFAQEPPPAEPAPPPDPPPTEAYEVVVYGELQVQKARAAVIQQLEDMGYDAQVIDRGNAVVYRHAAPWKGEVVLYDDGWAQVKRQPMYVIGAATPWAKRNTPLAWAGCVVWPYLCVRLGGALYGERKWRQVEDDSVYTIDPKVRNLSDRIADLATDRTVESLPDRLQALWDRGEPLGTGPALPTPAARRRAVFEYWASRTATPWGEEVREAVTAFCFGVIEASDDPFTAEELAEFRAQRPEFLARAAVTEGP
jgi:hypothetical protein